MTFNTLMPFIQQLIYTGTTIISDSLRAYNRIQAVGFIYQTTKHHYNFIDHATGAPTVELIWRNVKFKNKKQSDFMDSYLSSCSSHV